MQFTPQPPRRSPAALWVAAVWFVALSGLAWLWAAVAFAVYYSSR